MVDAVLDELSAALSRVGFVSDTSAALGDGIAAKKWKSQYAHVYVASVENSADRDWAALLDGADRSVLASLKSDEFNNGGVIDAHVCFVIDDSSRKEIEAQVDDSLMRNVSRKYWVERGEGIKGFQSRLSLLGVDRLSSLSSSASFGLSADDQEWIDMLVEEGPETIFQRFLSKAGCRP